MPHSDTAASSGRGRAGTAKRSSQTREIGPGELSRATIEVLAAAGPAGVGLDELKRRVAAAVDEPLPRSFQGEWLLQGIEVVHG